jgi:hypothetical protein
MVHWYHPMQQCWTVLIVGRRRSNLGLFHGVSHDHVSLLLPLLLFPIIIHLLVGDWLAIFLSSTPRLSGAECDPVGPSHSLCRCLPCWDHFPGQPHLLASFRLLRTSVAEGNVHSIEIGAFLVSVTADLSRLHRAPHAIATVVACPVMACTVATCDLAATCDFNVAPSIAELTSALMAHICEHFDTVPYSGLLNVFPDQILCHFTPLYIKAYQ